MNTLRFSVASIPEAGLAVDISVPVADVQPADAEALPATEARLSGTLMLIGVDCLFKGVVHVTYVDTCDRCLEVARCPVESDVLWHYAEHAPGDLPHRVEDEEDEETEADEDGELPYLLTGGMVDLVLPLWEELATAVPRKFVCDEDCKGLCNRCGANLNEGACACAQADVPAPGSHKGLAQLGELFPDLREKKDMED